MMSDGRQMRIAYILPSFPANDNDWCIPVIRNLVASLAPHIEPTVFALHYPYRTATYTACGATVHCLSESMRRGIRKLPVWFRLKEMMRREHHRAPYDLVHAFWGTETGYLAVRAARRLGIPSVVSLAGGELAAEKEAGYGAQLHRRSRWLVERSMEEASALTAGSAWLAAKVPPAYRDKLQVLPLGLYPAFFSPGTVRSGERLLSVASLIPLKDYPTLLHAVALARRHRPGLSLTIAGWKGDRSERSRIQGLVRDLGLQECVEILGEFDHDRLPDLYREHDLLLHSSLYEAQGMAILEGLATGIPVVSTNVGIVPSLPEELVYRCTPRDAEGMAVTILRSLADRHHAEVAYHRGPEVIRERFDAEPVAGEFVRLYEEIITQRTQRAKTQRGESGYVNAG